MTRFDRQSDKKSLPNGEHQVRCMFLGCTTKKRLNFAFNGDGVNTDETSVETVRINPTLDGLSLTKQILLYRDCGPGL